MILPGSELQPNDLEKLAACGISPELARQALLRRVTSQEGARLIGRNGAADYAGITFPCVWPGDGDHIREYRLRRDHPELELQPDGTLKERNKYLSPPGRGNLLYFVPGTQAEWLSDSSLPAIITEGAKKTLALWPLGWHGLDQSAQRPRFLSIGLSGVWNWRGTVGKAPGPNGDRRDVKGPIHDLSRVTWAGRNVIILFDVNIATNTSVQAARAQVTCELQRRGAKVQWFVWPGEVPQGVNGIDDLVAAWGPSRVLSLMKQAQWARLGADDWPNLEPIQSELPPVEAFSKDFLPESFCHLVADVAERMQVPIDFPAVVSLLCLAGVVNRRASIQPKASDTTWVVVPNLWGGIIAPPGFMKSPVIRFHTHRAHVHSSMLS
jgi:hypothetical protein